MAQKACRECGILIDVRRSRRIYCSNPCAGKGRWKNPEYRADIAAKMVGNQSGWNVRTKGRESFPEKFWRQRLEVRVPDKYVQEFRVKKKDVGAKGNGNYFLDFYFPDLKLNLEIDGRQHNDRLEYDAQRDRILKEAGMTVVRYRWPSGKSRFEAAHAQTEEFLNHHFSNAPVTLIG